MYKTSTPLIVRKYRTRKIGTVFSGTEAMKEENSSKSSSKQFPPPNSTHLSHFPIKLLRKGLEYCCGVCLFVLQIKTKKFLPYIM